MSKIKYSGIKWIGMIPQNWIVKKLKYLKNNEKNSFVDGDWIDSEYIEDKGIRYYTTGNIGDGIFKEQGYGFVSEKTFKMLKCKYMYPGDLIFSRLNAPYGRSCILPNSEEKCIIAVDNVVLRTNEDKKFLCYVTQTDGYHESAEDYSNGSTMQRISRTNLGNVFLPIPSLNEQKIISNFLDKKTENIDNIICDLEQQINCLIQYKESVITEKLLKNALVETLKKDGSITIKNVPNGWNQGRFKDVLSILTDYTANGSFQNLADNVEYLDYESYARLIRLTDLRENLNNSGIYVNKSSYKYLKKSSLNGGEVLVANVGAYAGLFCIMPYIKQPATLGPNMYLLKTNDLMLNKYLYYLGLSKFVKEQLKMKSTSSAQPKLNKEDVKTIKILIPPIEEQKEIINYLDDKCKGIDEIIDDKKKQKEQMEQYKKSVIYEYVTGKKRVEGAEELYG